MRLVMCARIMKPTFSVRSVAIHLWSRKTAMKAPRPSAVGRSLCMAGMHTASRVTDRDAKHARSLWVTNMSRHFVLCGIPSASCARGAENRVKVRRLLRRTGRRVTLTAIRHGSVAAVAGLRRQPFLPKCIYNSTFIHTYLHTYIHTYIHAFMPKARESQLAKYA